MALPRFLQFRSLRFSASTAAAAIATATIALASTACGPRNGTGDNDNDDNLVDGRTTPDSWVFPDAEGCQAVCGDECCYDGEVCAPGINACVSAVACDATENCQDDTYCDPATNLCLPYGPGAVDPTCTQVSLVGVFAPTVQCEWPNAATDFVFPNHKNVLATPMVVDFNFDGNAATLEPSIVFPSYDGDDGGAGAAAGDATHFGVIRVIGGESCNLQYTISNPTVIAASPLAIADLDGAADGRPEIVAHKVGGGLVAFKYNAGTNNFGVLWSSVTTVGGTGSHQWSGPSVYDLNDDGNPEVIQGGSVYNGQTGALLNSTLNLNYVKAGQIPVVADLFGDAKPELISGDNVYEWNAATNSWTTTYANTGSRGLVAVADFGTFGANPADDDRTTLDGIPEIAVSAVGSLRIQTIAGRVLLGPISLTGSGGPPTISDFDGDGYVEVGVAGQDKYVVYDQDCKIGGTAATCPSLSTNGILWSSLTQDNSSSVTGSAVFDFEGDGQAEVVYADECFSRVYDGKNGDILYSAYRTSCTWYENPIVADVDGDFNSEIVIPSNTNCSISCPTLDPRFDGLRCQEDAECPSATTCGFEAPGDEFGHCRCVVDDDCGGNGYVCRDPIAGPSSEGRVCRAGHPGVKLSGVRVISDALDRWVNSRPIWNQHAYSVTHVDDGGVCPSTSTWDANWTQPGLNNFRQAIAGDPDSQVSPDVTANGAALICEGHTVELKTQICNRGTESVGAGVPTTFYNGTPETGEAICTVTLGSIVTPGSCLEIGCTWENVANSDELFVTAVADDDGTGTSNNTECHEFNNRTTLRGPGCDGID